MMHRIAFVVFDGYTLLDLTGPLEVFGLAGRFGAPYDTSIVSPFGGSVASSSPLVSTETASAEDVGSIDTVIVVGAEHLPAGPIDPALLGAVSRLARRAARVASVCTGAFVLAELGVLDDRRATTHWRHAPTLARRFPRIHVDPDVIHARDGRIVTSAGITAGLDMALSLVETDRGARVAREIARELVVPLRRDGGQAQFASSATDRTVDGSPLRRVMDNVQADLAAPHSVATMAAIASVSERHLSRMFLAELGTTPARWVERTRLERATDLLLDGDLGVTTVAHASGFGSDETMRRAFARHLGTTPTEYRRRFSTSG